MRVTRSGKTLPVAEVPNLLGGDRLWIHPDLPDAQSVHYLLVVAFLRGSTNPPPDDWFIKAETWRKRVREEGIVLTVPRDAQQVLLFLAPETGGDFGTLRSAVQGKPGAFVRASQDLNQASLDRSRLDTYLEAVRKISVTDPEALHERSGLLARSLSIKVDQQCFDRPSEQQAPCLMQNSDELVLEDSHTQSMVSALTTGAGSDLIGQLTTTRVAGGGVYSAYVGAVVDVARMFENFHNPQYQYIPALAVPRHDTLDLKLNNPPSFRKPMSVLVIGLPPVEAAQTPPLRVVNAKEVSCLQNPGLLLPVQGAPLVFATDLGHEFVLRVKNKSGKDVDLPATADPVRGGFVIDTRKLQASSLSWETTGTIHGYWGFQPFDGPSFHLQNSHSVHWKVSAADHTALIVGREDALHLQSEATACVEQVTVKNQQGKETKAEWKSEKPDEVEIHVPLKNESAGPMTLLVKQYGLKDPDEVKLQAYSEAGHLDAFQINAGDHEGTLTGTRLDEVAGLEVSGLHFVPGALSRAKEKDALRLSAPAAAATALHVGDTLTARVALKDGRSFEIPAKVDAPRPKVVLVGKNVEPGTDQSAIQLGSHDEVPQSGKLSFFLKSEIPQLFPRDEKIEVAAEDGSFTTLLGLDHGTLVLEDSQNVLAQLDPLKSFGSSAFGPLRFRPVAADGTKGDWQTLATLVRMPSLDQLRCADKDETTDKPADSGTAKGESEASKPDAASEAEKEQAQCSLSGSNLFLIDSVASDAGFTDSVAVPLGLVSSAIDVPAPKDGMLYIKLRDDPSVVSTATPPLAMPDKNSSANRRQKSRNRAN